MANLQFIGTGRRKTSIARVRLVPGNGNITINKRDIDNYFKYETLKVIVREPLVITDTLDKYNIVDMFIDCKNFNKFKNKILPILMNLEKKYPLVFGNRTVKNLLNWQYIYAFHDAYMTQSEEKIEKLIDRFIDLIDFPFDYES